MIPTIPDYNYNFSLDRYAQQIIDASGRRDNLWSATTVPEMKAFVAINIMMGIKVLPRIWCYWSTNPALSCAWISGVMPQTRYLKLSQYLHVRDNTNMPARDTPGYDPLYKLRPLLDFFPARYREHFLPGRELAVDEAMIGFKGRLSFKQYMPAKPTKWGIKSWALCDSSTAYCLNFQVYTGRAARANQEHGLGYRVVMDMIQPYLGLHHHLYFDRFFTSPALVENLETQATYCCATVQLNRVGIPAACKKLKLRNRGDVVFQQKGNEVLSVWKDKRQVSILSTNANAQMDDGKPQAVHQYNRHMGGVDKQDQLRSYYKVARPSKKWWRYLFWFMLDTTIVNAWILFQQTPGNMRPRRRKGYDHLQFRVDLAEQLRAGFTSRKHRKGRKSRTLQAVNVADNVVNHRPVVIETARGKAVCRKCSREGRKTAGGYQVTTSAKCNICDIPLCKVGCFQQYHDN